MIPEKQKKIELCNRKNIVPAIIIISVIVTGVFVWLMLDLDFARWTVIGCAVSGTISMLFSFGLMKRKDEYAKYKDLQKKLRKDY